MKITYFLNFYPTKHKIVAHDEMIELTKMGHEITVISIWGEKNEKLMNLPFKVIYISSKIKWWNLLILLNQTFFKTINHYKLLIKYLGFQDSLLFLSHYHEINLIKTEHIHAHFANNAALKGMLLSKFLNVPFSCTGHGSELLLYPAPYLKELILNAKPFITISNYNKNLLIKKYSLSETDITVNYCGIDTDYFTMKLDSQSDIFTILSVSALKEIKGIKYLIDACKLLNDNNINFKCNIIGGGPDFEDLSEIINSNNLNEKIFLVGIKTQDEIKEYLQNSDIFVLPSLSEGIPIAVMEAMAMALPVIATNITGLPEIIIDNKNGYLVESSNSQQLAKKIKHLYHHPEIREKFKNNSRKIIEEKFNLKKNVTKFEQLITKL